MKISELLLNYKTDKNYGSIKPGQGHLYGGSYDEIFSWYEKNAKLNIMEIGVQKGGSLKAWKDFFPNASIIGVDIVDVREKEYILPCEKFILSDIKEVNIDQIFSDTQFDIIIDDGSHFIEDVIFVVDNYSEKLNINGVIIVEDVQIPHRWLLQIYNKIKNKQECYEIQYRDMRKTGSYDDFLIIIKRVKETFFYCLWHSIKNYILVKIFFSKSFLNLLLRRFLKC